MKSCLILKLCIVNILFTLGITFAAKLEIGFVRYHGRLMELRNLFGLTNEFVHLSK